MIEAGTLRYNSLKIMRSKRSVETHTSHTVDCRKALCGCNSSRPCHHRCKPDPERLWFSKRNQECRIWNHAFCEWV